MAEDPGRLSPRYSPSVLSGGGRITVALVLVGLVAVASTSRVESSSSASHFGIGSIVLLSAGAIAAVAIVFGGVLLGGYASLAETRRRTKVLAAVIAVLLLTGLGASLLAPVYRGGEYRCPVTPCPAKEVKHGHGKVTAQGGGHRGWSIASAIAGGSLLAALALIGGAMLLGARRRGAMVSEPEQKTGPVARAVEESIDDLRRERDVRRAVIACYARMERALEGSGRERRPQEAPFEYLARILGRIAGAAPAVRSLTELFEQAKFSIEPMGPAEKERAIAALEELRMEVYA